MSIPPVEALDFRLAAQYIERIADLATDIAARTADALEKPLVGKISPIAAMAKEMLSVSVANLFRFDSDKVAWVITAEGKLITDTATLREDIVGNPNKNAQNHLYVVDSLLRVGETAKDIADLALPQS
jgi:hypothetical protein